MRRRKNSIGTWRVVGAHVIGTLKVCRMLAEKYRNRQRRVGVRLDLLASLYNMDLKLLG